MNTTNNKPFAEIIESSITTWTAQSWQWNTFPQFGSLLAVEQKQKILLGIVYSLQTGSIEPGRYPFAYQKTAEELMAEQPHIFEFLRTTSSCVCVGYQEKGSIYYSLAPEPPSIHSFVQKAPPDLAHDFFKNEHFLHLIFGFTGYTTTVEDLLLALLAEQKKLGILDAESLYRFSEGYALFTGNDYRRLRLFAQRIEQMQLY